MVEKLEVQKSKHIDYCNFRYQVVRVWYLEFEFTGGGHDSEALREVNKFENIFWNKALAKYLTAAQLKKLLDIHEDAIFDIFTHRIEKLGPKNTRIKEENQKLNCEVKSLHESMNFQNETYKKMMKDIKKEKEN